MDINSRDPSQNIIPFRILGVDVGRFDQGGNLGIGTVNPTARLEVVGTTKISGNTNIGGNLAIGGNTTITGSINIINNPSSNYNSNDAGFTLNGVAIENKTTVLVNMDSQPVPSTALNRQKKQSIPLASASTLTTSDIVAKMSGVSVGKTHTYGVGPAQMASYGNIVVAVGEGTNCIAYSLVNPPTASSWIGIPNSSNTFTTRGWNIAYANGTWVAVGEGTNSIAYSTMTPPVASSWVGIPTGSSFNGVTNTFNTRARDIAYGNGVWVAVGDGPNTSGTNTIAYSLANPPTAESWVGIPNSTGSNFGSAGFGITFGNGTWVATGQGTNAFAYSTRTPPTFDSWITVSLSNTNDAGNQNAFNTNSFNVIYANGVWLAAGNGENTLCYSVENPPIAGSWMPITRTALFGGAVCWSIAYGNGTWVASANSTTIFAYSTARIPHSSSWIAMRGPTPSSSGEQINHITFNAATNTWYFMGDIGSNCMFYSTQTPPVPASWVGIQRSAGIFNTQAYGAIGITTPAFTSPINVARLDNKVTFPANRMLAVGGGGADVLARSANTPTPATTGTISYSDDDGVTWQMVPGGATNAMFSSAADIAAGTSFGVGGSRGANAVAWNGEKWVAAGNGRTNSLAFSDDGGMTWTGITGKSIFSVEARDIAWNGRMWVAVGRGIQFSTAYSYDGITWMGPIDASGVPINVFLFDIAGDAAATSDISGGGNHVIWTGKMWVATGTRTLIAGSSPAAYYTIAYSTDGKSWTGVPESGAVGTGFDMYAHGVAWNGRNYVATGRGTLNTLAFFTDLTSTVSGTWLGLGNTVFSVWGRGITWGAKRWMATGRGTNTVAYSTNGRNWQGCGANVFKPMRRFMAIGDTGLYTSVASGQPQRGVAFTYSDDGVTWDAPVVNQAVESGDTPLYSFTTHTFTNAGASGRSGPALSTIRSSYSSMSWAQNNNFLSMINDNGIQLWTVPVSGIYNIVCAGASGGNANNYTGGLGRRVTGVFALMKGEILKILVGQVGSTVTNTYSSGGGNYDLNRAGTGGGGTFVTLSDNSILLIGGGGGGARDNLYAYGTAANGLDAPQSTSGNGYYGGGTNGGGGSGWSGAGGGYSGDGAGSYRGSSFLNNGIGGTNYPDGRPGGGFGGGGGVYNDSAGRPGGGGGYSGGSGTEYNSGNAGGGGSFLGTVKNSTSTSYGDTNNGNGFVTVTFISVIGSIPQSLFTNQFLLTNTISDNITQHTALMYSTDAGFSWARVPGTSDTEGNGGTGMTVLNSGVLSHSGVLSLATNTTRTRFLVSGGDTSSATRKVYFSNDGFNWRNGVSSPNSTQMAWVYASLWVGGGYNRWLIGGNDVTSSGNGRIMYSGDADAVAAWLAASPSTYTATIISCFAANADFSVILAGTMSGNAIYRSANGGANWSTVDITSTPIGNIRSIAFAPSLGRWVAVGGGVANTIIYSTDATGNTWSTIPSQAKTSPTAIFKNGSEVYRVIWDAVGGRFIVGGFSGSSISSMTNIATLDSTNNNTGYTMAYSSDGIIWTPITVRSDTATSSGLSAGASMFGPFLTQCREIMALDMSGDFTPVNTGYSVSWNSYANRFIATGNGTTPVVYSSDGGVTWTPANQQQQQQAIVVAGGVGTSASTSSSSQSHIAYSIDGKTWSQGIGIKEVFGNGTVLSIKYGQTSTAISPNGRIWVAGGTTSGGSSCLAFSQNGIRWSAINNATTMIINVRTIAYAPPEQMIAVPGINNSVNNALTTSTSGVGNGVWVAGGDTTNSLIFSYDGISWSEVPNSLTILSRCNACAFGNGLFVAGGFASSGSNSVDITANMAYSTDGINWQPIRGTVGRLPTGVPIQSITYGRDETGRGLWVAGAGGSTTASIFYSYNGIDWVGVPSSGTNLSATINSIAYGVNTSTGQGLWVASVFRSSGYSFIYSTNGRDGWTSATNTKAALFDSGSGGSTGIAYLNGVWYATGLSSGISNGRTLAYSYDGISGWFGVYPTTNIYGSAMTIFSLTDMRCVATTADYAIPIGSSVRLTTSAGTAASSGVPSSLIPVRSLGWTAGIGSAYLQHPTLLFGSDNGQAGTVSTSISADGGRTWGSSTTSIARSAFHGGACNDAFWNGSIWAAVGYDPLTGAKVATSRDGISWSQVPSENIPIIGVLYSIMWNGTVWMVGGDGSPTDDIFTASIAWSTDLVSWTGITNTDTKLTITKRIAWNGMYWVAVGYGDVSTIMHSKDTRGLIWEDTFLSSSSTNKTASIISVVNDVVWGGGRWVAVGRGNSIGSGNGVSILYSADTSASGGRPAEYSISGRRWTAVAGSAQLFPYGANSISWNGKRFVATGPASASSSTGNIIAWSADGISWNAYSTTKTVAPGQRWVAVGSGSRACIALSADGRVWTDVSGSSLLFSDISGASTNLVNTMKTGARAIGWNGNSLVVGGSRSATTVTATSQFTATSSIGRTTIPVCAFIGSGNGAMGGGTSNAPMDSTASSYLRASSSVFITHLDVNMREGSAPYTNMWLNTYTDLSGTQLFQVTPEAHTFSSALKWNGWAWVANFGLTTNNPITGEQYGSIWYCTDPLARVGWSVASNYATPRILIGQGGYAALEWNGVAWLACGYDPNNNNLIYTTDRYGAIGWTAVTGIVSGAGSASFQPVCIASSSRFWVVGGSQGITSAMYYTSDRTGATGWRLISTATSVLPGIRITSIGYNGSAWICCGGGGGGSGAPASSISWRADGDDIGTGWAASTISGTNGGIPPVLSGSSAIAYNAGAASPIWVVVGDVTSNTTDQVAFTSTVNGSTEWKKPSGSFNLTNTTFGRLNGIAWTGYSWIATTGAGASRIASTMDITASSQWNNTTNTIYSPTLCTNAIAYVNIPISLLTTGMSTSTGVGAGTGAMWRGGVGRAQGLLPAGGTETTSVVVRSANGAEGTTWSQVYSRNFLIAVGGGIIRDANGSGGTNRMAYSYDGGLSWITNNTSVMTNTSNFSVGSIRTVKYGNGMWVAGGDATNTPAGSNSLGWSRDGVNWFGAGGTQIFGTNGSCYAVCCNDRGRWVAVGGAQLTTSGTYTNTSGAIYTMAWSDDGMNWTPILGSRALFGIVCQGVSFGADASGVGMWTAIGRGSAYTGCAYSYDGKNWFLSQSSGSLFGTSTNVLTERFAPMSSASWYGVAMSSTGQYQSAVIDGGFIYTSSDYGITWTARDSIRNWRAISLSSNGQYQSAVDYGGGGGYIYTSSDFGVTWIRRPEWYGGWHSVSLSSTGQYQSAVIYSGGHSGYIYTSYDYGVTWRRNTSMGNYNWRGISISGSGQYQTAVPEGNTYLWTSSDYGNTWTQRSNWYHGNWTSISLSSTGQYQTGVIQSSGHDRYFYTSSDYGVNWSQRAWSYQSWYGVAISSTGKYQTAVAMNGTIWGSTDFGSNWSQKDGNSRGWMSICMSSSGQYQTAVVSGGIIYISSNFGETWQSAANDSRSLGIVYGKDATGAGMWVATAGRRDRDVATTSANTMAYSYDGKLWRGITAAAGLSEQAWSVAYGKDGFGVGMWVAGGYDRVCGLKWSYDGITWNASTGASGASIWTGMAAGRRAITVYWNGSMWLASTSDTRNGEPRGSGIAANNASGIPGYLLYSYNGKNWLPVLAPNTYSATISSTAQPSIYSVLPNPVILDFGSFYDDQSQRGTMISNTTARTVGPAISSVPIENINTIVPYGKGSLTTGQVPLLLGGDSGLVDPTVGVAGAGTGGPPTTSELASTTTSLSTSTDGGITWRAVPNSTRIMTKVNKILCDESTQQIVAVGTGNYSVATSTPATAGNADGWTGVFGSRMTNTRTGLFERFGTNAAWFSGAKMWIASGQAQSRRGSSLAVSVNGTVWQDAKIVSQITAGTAGASRGGGIVSRTTSSVATQVVGMNSIDSTPTTGGENIGLYPFTTHTFTTAGASGPNGPSLSSVRSAYSSASWAQNNSFLSMTGDNGIQLWTVPSSGLYTITVRGASGGNSGSGIGGLGASMTGDFNLKTGDVLKILVGQSGIYHSGFASGGGGTFVTTINDNPIIVAGGGGGAGSGSNGLNASTGTSGVRGITNGGYGGINGGGGGAGQNGSSGDGYTVGGNGGSCSYGNGGGGFYSRGGHNCSGTSGTISAGNSFISGGKGGLLQVGYGGVDGGFGGGAGTGHRSSGGGGYSGGGGDGAESGAGGGGSYNSGNNQSNLILSVAGPGTVTITALTISSSSSVLATYQVNSTVNDLSPYSSLAVSTSVVPYTASTTPLLTYTDSATAFSTQVSSVAVNSQYNRAVVGGSSVQFVAGGRGANGGLAYSNGGQNWTAASTGTSAVFQTPTNVTTRTGTGGFDASFGTVALTRRLTTPLVYPSGTLYAVAINESGQYQTTGINGGQIWTSSDYGVNWTARADSRSWIRFSLSSSGQYQTAVTEGTNIWTSSDYGVTWTARDSGRSWYGISLSSTGQYQTAVAYGGNLIYTSSDYGVNWVGRADGRSWYSVSISSTGQYQSTVVNGGQIWVSSDYGVSWSARESSRSWMSIAISSTGQYQTAVVSSGFIYVSSDFGITWTARMTDIGRNWTHGGVSVSSTGQYQSATVNNASINGNGFIFTSNDFGVSWVVRLTNTNRNWGGISISGTGQYQTATVYSGTNVNNIYTSSNYGVSWVQRSTATRTNAFTRIKSSASGQYQLATSGPVGTPYGQLYVSSNYGQTWIPRRGLGTWLGGAVSGNGAVMMGSTTYGTPIDITAVYTYTSPYLSELKNPFFYEYTLDGDSFYIGDGGADMYDGGNYTQIRVNGSISSNLSYSQTTVTNVSVSGRSVQVISLGYSRPLVMLAFCAERANFGFNKTGNTGHDNQSGSTVTNKIIYNGTRIGEYTVYSWIRVLKQATGNVEHTIGDLYFIIGNDSTTFFSTTMDTYSNSTTDSGDSYMTMDCVGALAGAILISKQATYDINVEECQTVINTFISRIQNKGIDNSTTSIVNIPDFWGTYGTNTSANSFTLNNWTLYSSIGTYGNEGLSNLLISGNHQAGFLSSSVTIGLTGPTPFRIDNIIWDSRGSVGSTRTAKNVRIYGSNTSYIGTVTSATVSSNATLLGAVTLSAGSSYSTITISHPSYFSSYYFDVLDNYGDSSIKVYGIIINSGAPSNTALAKPTNTTSITLSSSQSLIRSTDYGVTFNDISGTALTSSAYWRSIAITNSASVQTAVAYGGSIYRSSDTGATWSNSGITIDGSANANTVTPRNWQDIAVSAETGAVQVTCVNGGYLYVSNNTGATWDSSGIIIDGSGSQLANRAWQAVAVSANGQYGLACVNSVKPVTSWINYSKNPAYTVLSNSNFVTASNTTSIINVNNYSTVQTLLGLTNMSQLKLQYKASIDGMTPNAFHSKVANIAPLFIVIRNTDGYIATAYSSIAFSDTSNGSTGFGFRYAASGTCWINNFFNPTGNGTYSTTKTTNQTNTHLSIYDHKDYGLYFGNSPTFAIGGGGPTTPFTTIDFGQAGPYTGLSGTTLFGASSTTLSDFECYSIEAVDLSYRSEYSQSVNKNSMLINSSNISIVKQLITDSSNNDTPQLKLIWKSTVDGWSTSTWHTRVNGISPLLIVIRSTRGYIATAYTSIPYTTSNKGYNANGSSFGLSEFANWLNPFYNGDTGLYSTVKYGNANGNVYAIYDNNSHGPTFGGGHDMYIPDNMNGSGYTNLGNTYTSRFPSTAPGPTNTTLFGSYNFTPSEIECYMITIPNTVTTGRYGTPNWFPLTTPIFSSGDHINSALNAFRLMSSTSVDSNAGAPGALITDLSQLRLIYRLSSEFDKRATSWYDIVSGVTQLLIVIKTSNGFVFTSYTGSQNFSGGNAWRYPSLNELFVSRFRDNSFTFSTTKYKNISTSNIILSAANYGPYFLGAYYLNASSVNSSSSLLTNDTIINNFSSGTWESGLSSTTLWGTSSNVTISELECYSFTGGSGAGIAFDSVSTNQVPMYSQLSSSVFDPSFNYSFLYRSTNSGVSWDSSGVMIDGSGSQILHRAWQDVGMSANGKYQVACTGVNGNIFYSKNYGTSWLTLSAAGSRAWSSVSISENGSTISATTNDLSGGVWTYTMPDDQYYRPAILDNSGSNTTAATVRAVAYGNSGTGAALDGYWLAGADASANTLAYSTNGIDWTAVVGSKTTLFNSVNSVAYGTDTSGTPLWVAVGLPFVGSVLGVTAYSIAYSYNMTTWVGVLNNANFTGQGNHVAFGQDEFGAGLWVAVGQGDGALSANLGDSALYNSNGNTNTTIFYSYDGANWAAATGTGVFTTSGTDVTWGVDASGVATWVATGVGYTDPLSGIFTAGGQVAHSTNGRVWTPIRASTAISPALSAITLPATSRGSAMVAPPASTGFVTPSYSNIWRMLGGDIDGEAADDYSGTSVSMSADGTIVAIGSRYNDGSGNLLSNSGSVRVYKYNPNKTIAQMNQSLPGFGPAGWDRLGADIDGEAASDESGFSVSLSSDGTTLAIGAYLNDATSGNTNTGDNRGHTRVYRYDANKTVAQMDQTLSNFGPIGWTRLGGDIDGETTSDNSGYSVSLSADGTIVAIGAIYNDGSGNLLSDSGHVRVYKYRAEKTVAQLSNSAPSATDFGPIGWDRLGADIDGEAISDNSGFSVTLSADGTTIAIGAIYNDGTSGNTDDIRGQTRVYKYSSSKTAAQMNQSLPNFGPIGWNRLGEDIDGDEYLYENYGPITLPTYNVLNFPVLNTYTSWEIDISFTSTSGSGTWRGLVGSMRNSVDTGRGWGLWVSSSNGIHFSTVNNTYDSFNGSVNLNTPYNLNVTKVNSSYILRLLNISTQAISTNSFSTSDVLGSGPVSIGGWPGAPQDTYVGTISYVKVLNYFRSLSGWSVRLSADGSIIAIGAQYNDANGVDAGHVRVYKYNSSKAIANATGPAGWDRLGGDIDGEASSDFSGTSVSLSADGTVVAIGSVYNDGTSGSDRGHVRVYKYNPSKTVAITNQSLPNFGPIGWERIGVDIDGEAPTDYSGYSVSLAADGTTLAIGAIINDGAGNNAGQVRVYKLDTFGAITYTSSNPSVAEIYGNSILFIKEGASGTTTITATQAATPPFTTSPITVEGTLTVSGTTYTLQYNNIMSTFTPFTGTGASALTVAYGRAGSQGTGAPLWIVGGSGENVFARSSRPSAITTNTWTVDASNAVTVPFPVCNSIVYSNGVWIAGNNTDTTNLLARSTDGGATWTPVTASSMSSILTGVAAVGANSFCNYSLAYADYSNDTNLRSWVAVQGTKNFMFEGGVSTVATVSTNISAASYNETGRAWWVAGGVALDGVASIAYTTDPSGASGWTRSASASIANLASINDIAFSPFTQQWIAVGPGATSSLNTNILTSDASGVTWTSTAVATAETPVIKLNTCIWNQLDSAASSAGRWLAGGTRNNGGVNNVTLANSASIYISTNTSGTSTPWTPIIGTGAILSQVYSIAYNGRVWIAAGVAATDSGSTSTLMRTTDPSGATGWVGITATNTSVGGFDTSARSIAWNDDQQMWIATGENTSTSGSGGALDASFSSVIYSLDVSGGAGTWRSVRESNSICFSGEGTGIAFTGSKWFLAGEGNNQVITTNAATAATASWSTVSHSTTLTRASDITYTGRRLIATGSGAGSTNGLILSSDNTGTSWSAGPSTGFTDALGGGTSLSFEASYEGVGRIVASGRSATNTLSVSTDGGSTWSAPTVQYSSSNTFDTTTQPLFTTGGNSTAYVGNDTLFAVGGNDIHWTGKRWLAVGRNSAAVVTAASTSSESTTAVVDVINNNTTPVATSDDGITWQCVRTSQAPNLSDGTFVATNSRIGSTPLIDSEILIADGGDTESNTDYGGMSGGVGGSGTGVASIDIISELTPASIAASSVVNGSTISVIGAAGNGSVGHAPIASFDTTAFVITTRPAAV